MPSAPTSIRATFAPSLTFEAVEVNTGVADLRTTTHIDLVFSTALTPQQLAGLTVGIFDQGGDNLHPTITQSGAASDETTQVAGPFVYRIPITGVLAESFITVRPSIPGVALAPFQIGHLTGDEILVHYDSTPPTLEVTSADRQSVTDAEVTFTSSETGIYYYLILPSTDSTPTADEVRAGSGPITLVNGTNTINISNLADGREYTVWILAGDELNSPPVGTDPTRNWTEVVAAPLDAFGTLTVTTAGGGSSSLAGPSGDFKTGTLVSLTATAAAFYEFVEWTIDGPGGFAVGSTPTDNPITFIMPSSPTTVTAVFAKSDIRVIFDVNYPESTIPAGLGPFANGSTHIDELIEGYPTSPAIGDVIDSSYRFLGWYPELHNLGDIITSLSWDFASDETTAGLSIVWNSTDSIWELTLHAAWAERLDMPISYGPASCSTCHYPSVAKEHQRRDTCQPCHSNAINSSHATPVTNWTDGEYTHAQLQTMFSSNNQSCGLGQAACHSVAAANDNLVWHGYKSANELLDTPYTGPSATLSEVHAKGRIATPTSGCSGSACHGSDSASFTFGAKDLASAHNDYWSIANAALATHDLRGATTPLDVDLTDRNLGPTANVSPAMQGMANPYACGLCHTRSADNTQRLSSIGLRAKTQGETGTLTCNTCHSDTTRRYSSDPACEGWMVPTDISGRSAGIGGRSLTTPTDVSNILEALSPQSRLQFGEGNSLQPGIGR
jgi:hypothetical protein